MDNQTNETVTLRVLAQRIASLTQTDVDTVEIFVKKLFDAIEDALIADRHVSVPKIGEFFYDSFSGKVDFKADNDIAESLNAPFSAFPAVTLDNDFPDDSLEETPQSPQQPIETPPPFIAPVVVDSPTQDSESNDEETSELIDSQDEAEDIVTTTNETEDIEKSENSENAENAENSEDSEDSEISEISEISESPENSDDSETTCTYIEKRTTPCWCLISVGILIGIIIGMVIGYFCHDGINNEFVIKNTDAKVESTLEESTDNIAKTGDLTESQATVEDAIVSTDSLNSEATESQPIVAETKSEEIAYDTVSTKRFLTTMAREHYGEMEYWVYIYKENESKLGNPNRIKPGTQVVIPPINKYVSDNSPAKHDENVAQARKLGAEIYSRYQ